MDYNNFDMKRFKFSSSKAATTTVEVIRRFLVDLYISIWRPHIYLNTRFFAFHSSSFFINDICYSM